MTTWFSLRLGLGENQAYRVVGLALPAVSFAVHLTRVAQLVELCNGGLGIE
jgi:hypothetical protein